MRFLLPVGGVTDCFGIITAPNHKGIPAGIKAGLPWAADVGCLQGPSFVKKADFNTVVEWLNKDMMPYLSTCLFVAGFDVVGDSIATLETYEEFSRYFISGVTRWPFAYVAQNGSEHFTCDGTRTRNDGTQKALAAWQGYERQRPLISI